MWMHKELKKGEWLFKNETFGYRLLPKLDYHFGCSGLLRVQSLL